MTRTARLLLSLAIVIPVVGIAAVFMYVEASRQPVSASSVESPVDADDAAETPVVPAGSETESLLANPDTDENPLRPLGPKASERVTHPSSPSCSSGSCAVPSRSSCSSCD